MAGINLILPPNITAARERFRDLKATTVKEGKKLRTDLSAFLATARAQLLQTADHHEYKQILGDLMVEAGLEMDYLHLVRSDLASEWKDYVSKFGPDFAARGDHWPDGNDPSFSFCYKAWGSQDCSNPFYVMEAKGYDPDGVIRLFNDFFGFGKVFIEARSSWNRANS